MIDLAQLLKLKYPEIDFRRDIILQDDGNGVYIKEWNLVDKQPTKEDLDSWEIELQAEYKEQQVYLLRQSEYPPKEDLIVAMWEKIVEGRGEKADELQILREQVKLKYPKL